LIADTQFMKSFRAQQYNSLRAEAMVSVPRGLSAAERHVAAAGPPRDELDDLFDYDVNMTDVFRDLDTNLNAPVNRVLPNAGGKSGDIGLGIDEEIKVAKKRKPIVKLDEARLLSQAGIPKLRRLAKERLKFKGKGHEYSDVSRLLSFYQLWLDDLFPKAKFADGLSIIEKLGHRKRMQVMRREWINEGKPSEKFGDDASFSAMGSDQSQQTTEEITATGLPNHPAREEQTRLDNNEDEGLYSATPLSMAEGVKKSPNDTKASDSLFISDDDGEQPPEDDLDALLAEDEALRTGKSISSGEGPSAEIGLEDNYEDELEVLADMDGMW